MADQEDASGQGCQQKDGAARQKEEDSDNGRSGRGGFWKNEEDLNNGRSGGGGLEQ